MMLLTAGARANTEIFKSIITKFISLIMMIYIVGAMIHDLGKTRARDPVLIADATIANLVRWLGLHHQKSVFQVAKPYLAFTILITLYFALKIRQKMKRNRRELTETQSVVFSETSRLEADKSFIELSKFLINYGFYKFGIEFTLMMFIVVIFTRLDIFAVIYIFWFSFLLFCNRQKVERIWKIATASVMAMIIFQCLILGTFVFVKPRTGTKNQIESDILAIVNVVQANLRLLNEHPDVLIYDFILLIFLSSQVCFPVYLAIEFLL